jgi:hypothetical protein
MKNEKYNYTPKTVLVGKLDTGRLQLRRIIENGKNWASDFYYEEQNHFKYGDKPVITEDNLVLSHWEEVNAAIETRKETIEVVVIEGLEKDDILRFIVHRGFFERRTLQNQFYLLKALTEYLTKNPSGITWAAGIHGKTRKKLATITGLNETKIFYIISIGIYNPKAFDLINEGVSSLTNEYKKIKVAQTRSIKFCGEDFEMEFTSELPEIPSRPKANQTNCVDHDRLQLNIAFENEIPYTFINGKAVQFQFDEKNKQYTTLLKNGCEITIKPAEKNEGVSPDTMQNLIHH